MPKPRLTNDQHKLLDRLRRRVKEHGGAYPACRIYNKRYPVGSLDYMAMIVTEKLSRSTLETWLKGKSCPERVVLIEHRFSALNHS